MSAFDIDWFHPPTQAVKFNPPRGQRQTPRTLPEIDKLYSVQDDLYDALGSLDVLHGLEQNHDFRVVQHRVESAYRSIVRYLTENSDQQGNVFG